jgi:hypothetical protein
MCLIPFHGPEVTVNIYRNATHLPSQDDVDPGSHRLPFGEVSPARWTGRGDQRPEQPLGSQRDGSRGGQGRGSRPWQIPRKGLG